jgi:hypothetical protein
MIFHTVLNNKNIIHSEWLGEDIYNLVDASFIVPKLYSYEILEVTEKYIARPDLISKDIYGDTIYSDLLCKLNGISNPFELNKGMLLVIPSPDNIMEFMFKPNNNEEQELTNKPVVKTKKDKRKANEAVVGDSRFKLDPTKGIVIY